MRLSPLSATPNPTSTPHPGIGEKVKRICFYQRCLAWLMGKVSRGWGGDWKSNSARITLLRPKKKSIKKYPTSSGYQLDWWPQHGWRGAVKVHYNGHFEKSFFLFFLLMRRNLTLKELFFLLSNPNIFPSVARSQLAFSAAFIQNSAPSVIIFYLRSYKSREKFQSGKVIICKLGENYNDSGKKTAYWRTY
jgi:hypothetical protein